MIEDRHRRRWTDEEDAQIERRWTTDSREKIAEDLGRTGDAVRSRAAALGLAGQQQPMSGPRATKNRVFAAVRDHGPIAIKDVSDLLDIPRPLAHHHMLELERAGRVERRGEGEKPSGRGRPPILWGVVKS